MYLKNFMFCKFVFISIFILSANYLSAQLQTDEYTQGIKNGFERYITKWEINDAFIFDSCQANVQYFNKLLNNQLDQVAFSSAGSVYFGKYQGFTVYALDSSNAQIEEKLIDSPLVGYIVLDKDEYDSGEVLADSVFFKLSAIMQLFQTGWPTYTPPEITTGFKAHFNRAENWGAVIFDDVVSDPQITCYDLNGRAIRLKDIQQISSREVNFSFPPLQQGVYILLPKAGNQQFESIKFNW
jgi:hypothetical protein